MRTRISIAAGAVGLLALTGCGQSEEEEFLEGMGCEEGQSAEECGEEAADEMMESAPGSGVEDTDIWVGEGEMPEQYVGISDDPLMQDREFTGRMTGDVSAGISEPVDLDFGSFEGIGDYVGTVTLDRAQLSPTCNGSSGSITPANEHFLFATFTYASDEAADGDWDLSAGDFRWEGFDDHISTYDTFLCEEAFNGLMDPVRPGESVERTLIFDVPETEGTLRYGGAVFDVSWDITRDNLSGNLPPE